MSHSDSEVKDDVMEKVRKLKKQLHIEFKAKRKMATPCDFRQWKKRLDPIYREIRFIQAVNTHHTDEVKMFLENGVSPNSTDTDKRSALHIACSKGYADIVEILLRFGANPNQRDIIQNTPLHLAACVHNYPIISMLIKANADVHSLDSHGRNPFQLASSKLQMLQRGWREGAIEMIKLREELQQVNQYYTYFNMEVFINCHMLCVVFKGLIKLQNKKYSFKIICLIRNPIHVIY